jgi:protein SCO1
VMTPEGRLSRYIYGLAYNPRDVRLALVEAGEGKIGSTVDEIMLFCFHYDPVTGKYAVTIMHVVRAAGALSALGIVLGIIIFLRREKYRVIPPGDAHRRAV